LPGGEEVTENRWFPYVNEARKNGVLIHGFAGTKPDWIRRYPLYTCDSTSWLMGSKFGNTAIFQNGRMRFHDAGKKQVIRSKHRHLYEKFGLDWDKIEAEDPAEVDAANLLSWLQYATYLTQVPNKDYWTQELNGAPKDSLGPPTDLDASELLGRQVGPTMDEGEMKKAVKEQEKKKTRPAIVPIAKPEDASLQAPKNGTNGAGAPLVKISNRVQAFVPREEIVAAPMECNYCNMQDRCRYFEQDQSCYYRLTNTYATPEDFLAGLRANIVAQQARVTHSLLQEKLDGGQLDRNLSVELDRLNQMIISFKDFVTPPADELKVEAKGKGAVSAILEVLRPRKRAAKDAVDVSAEPVS